MNNLFLKGKIVSILQLLIFTLLLNAGSFGELILNTPKSEYETVYILSFTIANLAMEPPFPIGETEAFEELPELNIFASAMKKNLPSTAQFMFSQFSVTTVSFLSQSTITLVVSP